MTARLIAIEGLDGSGKETQTKLLRQFLEAQGAKVGSISFPQYGEPSAALVEDYLKGGFGENAADVNAYAASSFFALDRLVSYLKKWRKEFESCDVFLADRYVTSNAIHQCSKLPESEWAAFTTWLFEYEFKWYFYLHTYIKLLRCGFIHLSSLRHLQSMFFGHSRS